MSISTAPIAMIGPVASTGLYPRDSITGSINEPSIAVVAIVDPEMAEKIVPATTATTARRPGHLADQTLDAINDLQCKPGMKKNLAHQDKSGNRGQREN
jgi:hypothetical protein